jgi:hypothetical protein
MAYYPKERNVNGVFYYGAAGSDQVLETNSTFTYNATDNVLNVSATGATTAFFDNQASIASSDDTDLLLLLTGTTTSNPGYRKITKANFSAALGGGTMSSWDLDGDTGTAETVENAESVVIAGGTGLASVVNATNTVTVNITGIQSDMIVDGSILNADLANSAFTLQGDAGSNQTISLGDTMDIAGGAGIQTTASATDTLTVAVTGIDPSLLIGASITLDGDQGTTEEVNLGDTLFVGGGAGLQSTVTATDTVTIAVTGIQSDMIVDGSIANGDLANSTITAAADNGSNQSVSLGGTLTIAGGTGIETTTSVGSDTVTINQIVTVNSGTVTPGELTFDVNVIDVNGGSESYSLPLNPPVGRIVRVKKGDSSVNTVTVTGAAGKPIDNGSSYILYNQWESATFICDADGWYVILPL